MRRLMMIGLDAADRELVEGWCEQGLLPNIAAMREGGVWAPMATTAEEMHVTAWPSIFTGVAPDQHGLYHAYVMEPGTQTPVRPKPEDCPKPFLWQTLSDAGKTCVVMDGFMSCPVEGMRGAQIVDWGTWTHFSETRFLPPKLADEIARRFGEYPAEDHSRVGMTPPPDPAGFRARLLAAIEKKTEVVRWLMDGQEWDLFLVVFGETHPAGHYFWHYQDAAHPAHSGQVDSELGSALLDVYQAIDRAIGELRSHAGEETTVMVVSGDGMGPNYSGSHMLDELLTRMRLLNDRPQTEEAAPKPRRDVLSTLRNLVPRELRAAISRNLLPASVNQKLTMHWRTAGIDWDHTRAFTIDNANEGYVRINLRGREPSGSVSSEQYREICEEIRRTAEQMTEPQNGCSAVRRVRLTDDIYDGPCRDRMPDVVLHWNPDARLDKQLATDRYGIVSVDKAGHEVPPFYTGNHRANAFAVAVGPQIEPGRILEGRHILDLAPTLLDYFGLPPSADMPGSVIRDLTAAALAGGSR